MNSRGILQTEEAALAGGLKAVGEPTSEMNDSRGDVSLHMLIGEVPSVVLGSKGSRWGRFGEGRGRVESVYRAPVCTC